jgi:hypothetical protein
VSLKKRRNRELAFRNIHCMNQGNDEIVVKLEKPAYGIPKLWTFLTDILIHV